MSNEITLFRGDSATIDVHVVDGAGADYNLTPVTEISFTVKTAEDDTTPLLQKLLSLAEITITDMLGGEFTIVIDAGDTTPIPGVKYYDIELQTATEVYTVVKNTITITKELTV